MFGAEPINDIIIAKSMEIIVAEYVFIFGNRESKT